jgi:peptidoglycan hydrolase-like protein with peptidoglycan-binding domain
MIAKNTRIGVLCLTLALTGAGCDAIYRMLQKEGAEEKDLIGVVDPFTGNESVEEVQALLKLYGYKIGRVDGKLGGLTRNAIEEFQKDEGLELSRFIDQNTWTRLHQFSATGLVENAEVNIRVLQTALNNAGLNTGGVDGKLGPKTLAAIKSFQEAQGLKPDGIVGIRTLKALNTFLTP